MAVKALETGIVPPVPNFKEVDPDLGDAQPVPGVHSIQLQSQFVQSHRNAA